MGAGAGGLGGSEGNSCARAGEPTGLWDQVFTHARGPGAHRERVGEQRGYVAQPGSLCEQREASLWPAARPGVLRCEEALLHERGDALALLALRADAALAGEGRLG